MLSTCENVIFDSSATAREIYRREEGVVVHMSHMMICPKCKQ